MPKKQIDQGQIDPMIIRTVADMRGEDRRDFYLSLAIIQEKHEEMWLDLAERNVNWKQLKKESV